MFDRVKCDCYFCGEELLYNSEQHSLRKQTGYFCCGVCFFGKFNGKVEYLAGFTREPGDPKSHLIPRQAAKIRS